jgi:hypothetical protein
MKLSKYEVVETLLHGHGFDDDCINTENDGHFKGLPVVSVMVDSDIEGVVEHWLQADANHSLMGDTEDKPAIMQAINAYFKDMNIAYEKVDKYLDGNPNVMYWKDHNGQYVVRFADIFNEDKEWVARHLVNHEGLNAELSKELIAEIIQSEG